MSKGIQDSGVRIQDIQNTARAAAKAAGKILLKYFQGSFKTYQKSRANFVTDADLAAEKKIKQIITKAFPDHQFLAEESDRSGNQNSDYCWIIDPLDGTHSFLHGFHYFSVSIALEYRGQIVYGLVYAPFYHQLFEASLGKGATMNGKRIKVSGCKRIEGALLATGFPYHRQTVKENNLKHFYEIGRRCFCIRRGGSAALDLCYVANGTFDGYWEFGLSPWDVAAASLIFTEAGGRLVNIGSSDYSIYRKHIVAAGPLLFPAFTKLVHKLL